MILSLMSLKQLRVRCIGSRLKGNWARQEKISNLILKKFPANSLGYAEACLRYISLQDYNSAKVLAVQCPVNKVQQKLLAFINFCSESELCFDARAIRGDFREYLETNILGEVKGNQSVTKSLETSNKKSVVKKTTKKATKTTNLPKPTSLLKKSIGINLLDHIVYIIENKSCIDGGDLMTLEHLPLDNSIFNTWKDTYRLYRALVDNSYNLLARDYLFVAIKYLNKKNKVRAYLLLGDLYKNDANYTISEVFYNQGLSEDYDERKLAKLISLYGDSGFYEKGSILLDDILSCDGSGWFLLLPIVDRIIVKFPDKIPDWILWRNNILNSQTNIQEFGKARSSEALIKARSINLVSNIFSKEIISFEKNNRGMDFDKLYNSWQSEKSYISSNDSLLYTLCRIRRDKECHTKIFECADLNLNSDTLTFGVLNGEIVEEHFISSKCKRVLVTIPTVFYVLFKSDKEIYSNIREVLKKIYNVLLNLPNIFILVKHQFNWREIDERGTFDLVISYHIDRDLTSLNNYLIVQESTLPGRFSLDRLGYAGFSSLSKETSLFKEYSSGKDYLDFYYKSCHEFRNRKQSKYEQNIEVWLPKKPYIFLPLQVVTDAVAELTWIKTIDVIDLIVERFKGTKWDVVIKKHPLNKSFSVEKKLNEVSEHQHVIISDASIHDLIDQSDAVFLVNSGVGLEALFYEKPVYAFGESDYSYAVSRTIKTEEDLNSVLSSEFTFDLERVAQFIFYYLNEYTFEKSVSEIKINELIQKALDN